MSWGRCAFTVVAALTVTACSGAADTSTTPTAAGVSGASPTVGRPSAATDHADGTDTGTIELSNGEPTGDTIGDTTGDASDAVRPDGFATVKAKLAEPDGSVCELCLWLADTGDQRERGLMFVTDLGAGDGMAFRYPSAYRGAFWMKNTVMPLSIGFYAPDGTYLDGFDMQPCTDDPCRTYPTPNDFLVAIEVAQGRLAELGIVPGSVLTLTDLPCTATGR